MITIRAEIRTSTSKDDHKNIYSQLLDSFVKLGMVLDREREAILALEEESLDKSGIKIDNLLSDISEMMLYADRLDTDQIKELAQIIARVKEKRQDNHRLLEDLMLETGRAIGRANSGRRVLQAYGLSRPGEELFVKREC